MLEKRLKRCSTEKMSNFCLALLSIMHPNSFLLGNAPKSKKWQILMREGQGRIFSGHVEDKIWKYHKHFE